MKGALSFFLLEAKTLLLGNGETRREKAVAACCLLAVFMFSVFLVCRPPLRGAEAELWDKARAAQSWLWAERERMNIASDQKIDPWRTGLIGLEWSPITTTMGKLEAKRTATDPGWAVLLLKWYRSLGLLEGDRLAILASGSFPGFLLSAILAAEKMDLELLVIPSLGASSWGANLPDLPLTAIIETLRRGGFIRVVPGAATLGGAGERATDLSPEGRAILMESLKSSGIPLIYADTLEGIMAQKWETLAAFSPKVIVQIGGSQANLGTDDAVLKLDPGIILPEEATEAGNGIIARALESGIPVIHMLDVRALSREAGIPYDGKPKRKTPGRTPGILAIFALAAWGLFLLCFRRWTLEKGDAGK